MTEKPFVHDKAFANVKTSFMFHQDVVKILFKLLKKEELLMWVVNQIMFIILQKKNNPNIQKKFF